MSNATVEEDSLADTRASPSAPNPPVAQTLGAESRHTTVLPCVEWQGDRPRLVASNRARFEELRELGRGGMGEVVLARDLDIDRTVALKKLPEGTDVGQVLRFVEEVRAVGKLEHPNIVPVHDVGIDQRGRYFFVMKHLEGESLDHIIRRLRAGDPEAQARFTRQERMQIILGVLHAVAYAHQQGFVHRDLKPGNIMVGPFGEVTVVDWGVAKRLRSPDAAAPPGPAAPSPGDTAEPLPREDVLRTRRGALVGTPLYMSPEQARGEHDRLDARSDLYSIAVIAHELTNLTHYLDGRSSLEEVLEGAQTVLPSFPSLVPKKGAERLPAELAWFLDKGLSKDPAQRFQTAGEMADALTRLLDGHFRAQCPRTAMKRGLHMLLDAVDTYPLAAMLVGPVLFLLALAGLGNLALQLLR